MDSSAALALREFLSSKYCNLTYLSMANANIDDYEVHKESRFVCAYVYGNKQNCMYICSMYCVSYVCTYVCMYF